MQENTTASNRGLKWVLTVVILSLAYAVIRYNVARQVPYAHLPLSIANKAIALSAALLIGLSYLLGPLARFWPKTFTRHLDLRKYLGISGFAIAALHAIMALAILTPAYFPRLFEAKGQLTFIGETTMLMGILAFLIFSAISVASLPPVEQGMHPEQWKRIQRLGYLAYVLVLFHVGLMGYSGWFQASSWKYGLVSISLLASLFILFVLVMRVIAAAMPRKAPTQPSTTIEKP